MLWILGWMHRIGQFFVENLVGQILTVNNGVRYHKMLTNFYVTKLENMNSMWFQHALLSDNLLNYCTLSHFLVVSFLIF